MTEQLISALIEKDAFVSDTIFTASYISQDRFGRTFPKIGDFKLHRVIKQHSNLFLELRILENAELIIKTETDSIQMIDGMDLQRFADIYDLNIDGSEKKIGKKRGRKPKIR